MTVSAGYDIHGVTLTAHGADQTVVDALDRRLTTFRTRACDGADIRLELGTSALAPPAGRCRPVYDAPGAEVLYFDGTDELYLDYRGVRLHGDPGAGSIRLSWAPGHADAVWLATHPLLTIALLELLKRRGMYSLHAACAATGERGIVVAGPSGAGKSTLAIALSRAGMSFLSDDLVFLAPGAARVDVLGFPDEVDVSDQTLAMFPDLPVDAGVPRVAGREKRSFRPEDAVGLSLVGRCRAAVVVLAGVAHTDNSRITPVAASEALVALAPNVLLTESRSAQAHLDMLGTLVAEAPCFRLDAGRDIDRLTDLLGDLVA